MSNNAQKNNQGNVYTFDPVMFGKRVREARKQQGWNQEKLAEEVFRSGGGYISDIERGKRRPSFETAVEMAEKLEVSLDYLCGREEYMNNKPVTMGDVARVLMMFPFLDGVECEVVDVDVPQTNAVQPVEKKSAKKKREAIIKIRKKPLNKFLDRYRSKLKYRTKYAEFIEWREKSLAELDAIPAWGTRNLEKWGAQVDPSDSWHFPEEEFKPLIWNRNFPYVLKNMDE